MLTPQGPIQHIKALMGKLTQIECQSLTRRLLYHQQNWGVLTQDNLVLQTVQGYLMDLTHTPHQSHIPPPIDLSQEKHALVTQEVQELLSKGAVVESIPSPMSFISQIFLVEKGGGATTSDQPKGFEPICVSGTLQNLGPSPDTRLTPIRGLDGENGFERCLSPNSNTSRSPTSPIHLGAEALQVPVPSIWPLLCTTRFHKTTETSGGLLKADRLTSNSVSGRYVVHAHQQGSARGNGTSDLQNFRSPWLDGEYKEIPSKSNPGSRVSGLLDQFPNNDIQSTIRKGQKNSAGSSESTQISVNFSATPSCLHRESCSSFQGRHTCPPLHYRALQRALKSATSEHNPLECLDKFDSQVTLNSEVIMNLHWWSALNKQTVATPVCPPQPVLVIESDASQLGWEHNA